MQTPGSSARTLSWVAGAWVLGFPLVWSIGTRALAVVFEYGFGLSLPIPYIFAVSFGSLFSFVLLVIIALALSAPRGRLPPYRHRSGGAFDYPLKLRPVGMLGFVLYGAFLLLPYVTGDALLGYIWSYWRARQRKKMAGQADRSEEEELEQLGIMR